MTARRHRFWLDTPRGFVAATWFWPVADTSTPSAPIRAKAAVVIVPGFAVEERTMATGLAAIAEACAEAGIPAIVFDLEGVAQSADALTADDIVERWPEDVRVVVDHVRSAGFGHVIAVAVRSGALAASCAAVDAPIADAMVLWAPVTSGRRLGRELALLRGISNSTATPADDGPPPEIEIAGFAIPRHVLSGLRRLELLKLKVAPAPRVLILDDGERNHDEIAAHWCSLGADVEETVAAGTDAWLMRSMDGSDVPVDDIGRLLGWINRTIEPYATDRIELALDRLPTTRAFVHDGTPITETLVGIGAGELFGVWCEPEPADAIEASVRVLAAPVGPGRCFVEFARDEAAAGRSSLRFEFSGSGTSPRRPGQIWNSHYSHAGSLDVAAALDHAAARHARRAAVIGFCSSAWSALQAGPRPDVAVVAALNVHLYVSDGASSALNVVPRSRLLRLLDQRLSPNRRAKLFHRMYRTLPLPGVPMRWTESLLRHGVTVLMHFDAHDPGLLYLRKRMPERWNRDLHDGTLQVSAYDHLGHSLEGPQDRRRLMAALSAQLSALDVSADAASRAPEAAPPPRR
ncbi:MAG: alpha/beta hydrolase [Acidimicrobiales bacterium]|nr:alpha/beta hydrolase [Acidimicrobiales bacterium]